MAIGVNAQDAGVDSIISPKTSCGLLPVHPITVRCKNYTAVAVPANTILLGYSINGAAPVTQLLNVVLPASGTVNFTFTVKPNLSAIETNYHVKAYTSWASDPVKTNDTTEIDAYNFGPSLGGVAGPPDTVCIGSAADTIFLTGYRGTVLGWFDGTDGVNFPNFTAGSDTFIAPGILPTTTYFRAAVKNGQCFFQNSTVVKVQVDVASVGGSISGAGAVCDNNNSGTLTLSGHTGSIQRWESSVAGTPPWTNLAQAGVNPISYSNIKTGDPLIYRAMVKLGVCPVDSSDTAAFSIDPISVGGTVSYVGDNPGCSGSNSGTLSLNGQIGDVDHWESKVGAGAFASIGFAGLTSVPVSNLTATTTYRAIVKSGSCSSINSTTFTVNVDSASLGGVINSSVAVCTGANGGTLNLINYRGTSFQWQKSIDAGGTWNNTGVGDTLTGYSYNNIVTTTHYRVLVKNGVCSAIPSAQAIITVSSPSLGGTIATSDPTTVCAGSNGGTLTYSGGNGAIQGWEKSISPFTSWTPIANLNTTLNYTNLVTTTKYRVIVKNTPCDTAASSTITITVLPASVAGTINGASPKCTGSTVTLTLTGKTGNVLTWRRSTDGGANFSNIPGSALQTTISPVISVNTLYQAIVQQGTCAAETTANKSITVNPVTVPGTVASSKSICSGDNSGVLTLSGNVGNPLGWISSINGGLNWSTASGSTPTSTFTSAALTQTTMFKARVKSGVCPEDSSTAVTISVTPAAVGGTAMWKNFLPTVVTKDTICAGLKFTVLTLNNTHTGSVLGWEYSTDGGANYTLQSSTNNFEVSFNFTYTTNTLWRALVQNGTSCDTLRSSTVLMVVDQPTVGGIATGSATVCGGSNNGFVTVSGHTGSVQNWEFSVNNGTVWTPVSPVSATTSYNYVGLNQNTWFRAIVKNGKCNSQVSDTAVITIIPAAIGGVVNYLGGNVCSGSMTPFTLNLNGSSGGVKRWERSNNGSSWTAITNTTTSHTDSNITQTRHYRAVLESVGSCPEVNSIPDTVFVDPVSNAGTASGSAVVCDTGNSGNVFITGYTGQVVVWRVQKDGAGFASVPSSAGEDTISYSGLTAGVYEYKAVVKSGSCDNDTSAIVTVTVNPDAVAGTLSGGASYCTPVNATLLSLTGYTGTTTWQRNTTGNWNTIAAISGQDTATFKNITVPTMYRVIVTSGVCGNDTSNVQTIDVGQSVAGTLNQDDSVCISGHNNLLQLSGYTGSVAGWQDSSATATWGATFNATFDTLRVQNLTETTKYRVIVQSGSCTPDTSNTITITVSDTVSAGTLSQDYFYCDTTNSDTILLTGYFGPIENWYQRVDGGPWTPFSPVKTDGMYIFNNLLDSITEFRVAMNGGVCGADTSNIVKVEVRATLIGTLAVNDTVCSGNNQGVIRLTGYAGTILGWDSATSGIFSPMSHTADSLVYMDLNDTTTYRVRIQNPGCPADTSNEVTIVTVPGTTPGLLTGSRSLCSSTNSDSIILVGRVGTLLGWESSINLGGTWSPIGGQTTDTLIFTNLTQETWYRVIVQGQGLCPDDTSNIAIVQIGPSAAGVISGDTHLCAGTIAHLVLTGSNGDVVMWQSSENGGLNWNPVPSSDTNKISYPTATTTLFRAIVQSDTCTPDTSAQYQLLIDQPYTGTLVTPTTQLCYGIGSDTIFLSDPVETIFDWEIRADNVPGFASLNNDTTFQRFDTLKITTHYRVFVKNGLCPSDTVSITLVVDTFTLAGSITGDATVCSGDNNGVIILGGHIGNTFTWQASTDGGLVYNNAPGATNDTFYVYNDLTDTTRYRVIVASGGCPADTTNTVDILVKPAAIGGTVLADASYCKGPNNGILNLTGYFGNIVGWQQSIGGGAYTAVVPANTTDTLSYLNLDTTTSYRVLLSYPGCPDDTSTSATITILKTPVTVITADGLTEFCLGDSVNLTASGGPDYSWNTGDTISTIKVKSKGKYIVIVTEPTTGCTDSDSMLIDVFKLPVVDAGDDQTIFTGESAQLLATGAAEYEWTPKTGLDDGFISNPLATPLDTTEYIVVAVDSNGCIGSDTVVIFVVEPPDTTNATTFTNLFTPNGDGHNDTWKITAKAKCAQCKLAVYNRYGQEVYTDEDYQDDWEGTFNGKKLPDGTYYYVVSTETGKIYKGALTILRGE